MEQPALATAALKLCATACVLLTFLHIADKRRPRRRRTPSVTLLDLAYVICNGATSLLCAWQAHLLAQFIWAQSSFSILGFLQVSAIGALSIATILAAVVSMWLRYRSDGTSFLLWAAHCLHLLALIIETVDAQQETWQLPDSMYSFRTRSTTLLLVVVPGSCLFSGLQDFPVIKQPRKKDTADKTEDTHSVFRRLACAAVFRHIWNAAFHARVVRADLPVLGEALRCGPQMKQLRMLLPVHPGKAQPGLFIFRVLCVLRQDLLWCITVNFAYYASLLIRIPLLEELLRPRSEHEASTLTVLLVASCGAEFLLACVEAEHSHNLGVRTNSLCQAAVFTKMLRMTPSALSAYPAGRLVSVMAVECPRVSMAATGVPRVLVGLMCTPFVHYALSVRAGLLPVVCCVAWQLLTFLLLVPHAKLQRKLWARVMKSHDVRLQRTTDLLSSVRLVKLYAWEDTFADIIARLRCREVKEQFVSNLADGFVDSLFVSCSGVMTIVLFGTHAWFHPEKALTASLSFSCLYAISLLDPAHINTVPVLRHTILAVFGLKRIAKACTEEEMDAATGVSNNVASQERGSVHMVKCSFSWSGGGGFEVECPDVVLRDVNIRVEAGAMVGVVGFVGIGKSALLAAIQGEIHRVSGSVTVRGSVAFVPQVPCIYNMSIRDNILFGKPLKFRRYERVLEACDLLEDVARFPLKDLTEVGERGATLSGGQKQRVSLARAVYSDSDVYLLDDTLSALDIHVASKVFNRIIGKRGIISNKTRIVVCNEGRYLERMDRILLVSDRRVTAFESLTELRKNPGCPETVQSDVNAHRMVSQRHIRNYSIDKTGEAAPVQKDEIEMSKMGGMDLFLSMVRIGGPSVALAFTSFALRAASIGTYLVWIKQWTDASGADGPTLYWIFVLAALCISDVFFGCMGGTFLALSFRSLTGRLHKVMLRRVLGSPVSFFDANPRGRVLTRFSADLDSVDSRFFLASKQLLQTLTAGVARIVVSGLQVPMAGVLGGLAVAVFLILTAVLSKASNAARRLESVECSFLLQHVAETRDSVSVVRSYGAEERFRRHGCRLLDSVMRAMLTLVDCVRSVRFSGGLCGFLAVLASAAFALHAPTSSLDATSLASTLGLTLSASMGIPLLITGAIAGVFVFFQTMVSFERCLEYTRLPAEVDTYAAQGRVAEAQKNFPLPFDLLSSCPCLPLGADWPSEGKIHFETYTASYRPGVLPNVLKDVSFLVKPRERVGVVGRTGAGKSSLIMALLRVLNASEGSIRIDDVNIASVPLRKLRSVVTVIPQDPSLTRGSLRDVLDPARSHSEEDIWRVLEQVHMREFVANHPDSICLEVGDSGSNLSAGQRQLVCLARALLRRPRVLLLDEATSSLDGDADRLIQRTLRQSFTQCTVLTVAHRLDTVPDYDKILVMQGGRVAEFGHTSALASDERSAFHAMLRRSGLVAADTAVLGSGASWHLSTRL